MENNYNSPSHNQPRTENSKTALPTDSKVKASKAHSRVRRDSISASDARTSFKVIRSFTAY